MEGKAVNPSDKAHMAPLDASISVQEGAVDNFGYEQTYRRALSSIGSLCVTIAIASPLNALLVIAGYQITYGGYWGLVWGWIIPGVLFLPQALAVAALCSSMPVNGAFYWWTAALAPPKLSRPLSFVSGWTIILSIVTSIASFSYAIASPLARVVSVLQPSWVPTQAQTMAIAMGIVVLWSALATCRLETVSWLVKGTTILNVLLVIVWTIAMPSVRAANNMPMSDAKFVFSQYTNSSDWTQGIAVCMTFLSSAWVVTGWAAPAYLVEGTKNSNMSAPKGIVSAYSLTALLGIPICIVTAFCIPDIEAAAVDETGYPMYTMVFETFGSKGGSAFFLVSAANLMLGASSFVLSSACNMAAFARDGGIPFATTFAKVHPTLSVPVNSVILLGAMTICFLLIALSPAASTIIYSLAVVMGVINYSIPNILVLARPDRFTPGPFNYGRWTRPIFALAVATQVFLVVIEALPASSHWTAETFNYNWVAATGAIGATFIVWYFIGSKFKGVDLIAVEDRIFRAQMENCEASNAV